MKVRKKIVYVLICYEATHSGVFKKILDQVNHWKSSGHIVQLFVITDERSEKYWREIDPNCVVLLDSSTRSKVINRIKLVSLAAKTRPSIIYLRDSFPLRIPNIEIPIIIEIELLLGQELRNRSTIRHLFFLLLKRFHYRHISGAIYVTNELKNLNEFRLGENVPKIVIGNAIYLDRITPLSARPDVKPALFFVGTPNQPWHGISEMVEFAKANPDIQVEIVGYSGDRIIPNINFHGILDYADYREVATKCIAGVGTLNLSAKKMTEASPLKVREYLALGLPVILKYVDTDLDSTMDFVLHLPLDERKLIDFSIEIRSFLEKWSNKRVTRSQLGNLDVALKEKMRLDFFETVTSEYAYVKIKGD